MAGKRAIPGTADYDRSRFGTAVSWVAEHAREGDALFDVGCGTGQMLEAMAAAGVDRLAGCDLSAEALTTARERVEFTAHHRSILDEAFVTGLAASFRFVTMSAVLHHLVGRTRRASRLRAEHAVTHALRLLTPDGLLLIIEPTYSPGGAMTVLFWTKRVLGVFGRRIELGRWNNIGAPVVSYYTPAQLRGLVASAGGRVLRRHDRPARLRRLPRILGIRGRWETTLLVGRVTRNEAPDVAIAPQIL
jgi:SAM-dependent methyltransferase